MFFDVALVFDPVSRTCDWEIVDGDLLIDETPITPCIISIGFDRRAAPDDQLPQGRDVYLAEAGFNQRRGGPADALDPYGEMIGSKLWLLDRAKKTETTRLFVQTWLEQCLTWANDLTGQPAQIETRWLPTQQGSGSPTGRLAYRVLVAGRSLELTRSFGNGI